MSKRINMKQHCNRKEDHDIWRICIISGPLEPFIIGSYIHVANFIHLIEPLSEEIFVITSNFPTDVIDSNKIQIINIRYKKIGSKSMFIKTLQFIIMQLKMCYNLIKISNEIDIVFLIVLTEGE